MTEWISVKDRLPDRDCKVLGFICLPSGGRWVDLLFYSGMRNVFILWANTGITYNHNEVTHWMPLPEPPEEAEI